jgi:hypothetical protein
VPCQHNDAQRVSGFVIQPTHAEASNTIEDIHVTHGDPWKLEVPMQVVIRSGAEYTCQNKQGAGVKNDERLLVASFDSRIFEC